MTRCKLHRLFNTKSFDEIKERFNIPRPMSTDIPGQRLCNSNTLLIDVIQRLMLYHKVPELNTNIPDIQIKVLNNFYCSLDPRIEPFTKATTGVRFYTTLTNIQIIRDAFNRKYKDCSKDELVKPLLDIIYDIFEINYPQSNILREDV